MSNTTPRPTLLSNLRTLSWSVSSYSRSKLSFSTPRRRRLAPNQAERRRRRYQLWTCPLLPPLGANRGRKSRTKPCKHSLRLHKHSTHRWATHQRRLEQRRPLSLRFLLQLLQSLLHLNPRSQSRSPLLLHHQLLLLLLLLPNQLFYRVVHTLSFFASLVLPCHQMIPLS